jgi:hypothetical protein
MAATALVLAQGEAAPGAPGTLGQEPEKPPAVEAPTTAQRPGEVMAWGPGSEYPELEPLVGRFRVDLVSPANAEKPLHLRGVCENRLVFGGRVLLSEWAVGEGESRTDFFSLLGYDGGKKQFFAVGADSRHPSLAELWGSYDPASRSFILSGKQRNESTGAARVYRDLLRIVSRDSHVLQVFHDVPGRPMRRVLEVTFTRE